MRHRVPLLTSCAFHVPKRGNTEAEYEDYCEANEQERRFAIADGASESSFAKQWANILVKKFLRAPIIHEGQWEHWLPQIQKLWCEKVDQLALPWFAQPKADMGAFATFVGLTVEDDGTWQSVAVGDACLFHRRGAKVRFFPIRQSADFNSTPPLIGARLPADDIIRNGKHRACNGRWEPGDVFFLMTDALAQWYMQALETRKSPPLEANPAEAPDEFVFAERVEALRSDGQIRDDDLTLLRVEMLGSE